MANKSILIKATQKLISDITDKVLKATKIVLGKGLTGSTDFNGQQVNINLDEDYIKNLVSGAGGETYSFKGDDYIDVYVDGIKQ